MDGNPKPRGWQFIIVWISVALLSRSSVQAEHYLSSTEARTLCFPAADRFDNEAFRLTPEQMQAVEKRSGVKVRQPQVQMSSAWQGQQLLGFVIVDQVYGKHELIDYLVALSPSGGVLQVEVMEYREKYGKEVRSPKWRSQFGGKTAHSSLKLNEDIYNISGATISCRNITEGVKRLLATYDLVGRLRLPSNNRLQHSGSVPTNSVNPP
jgi:Na+-translocating ferredoxin:NAD+ oxidoreductase RnfG subunit